MRAHSISKLLGLLLLGSLVTLPIYVMGGGESRSCRATVNYGAAAAEARCMKALVVSLNYLVEKTIENKTDSDDVADQLVKEAGSSVAESDVCSICLDEIGSYDVNGLTGIRLRRCSHGFHEHCILQWLAHNNTCPNCRTKVEIYLETWIMPDQRRMLETIDFESVHRNEQIARDALFAQHLQDAEQTLNIENFPSLILRAIHNATLSIKAFFR